MMVRPQWCGRGLGLLVFLCLVVPAPAQETPHVVSVEQLSKDAVRPAETRRGNESALRRLFSSQQSQEALKSTGIDYQRVDKAISQISDEDLGRLAARAREVNRDFVGGKAGSLSDRDLLVIIIVAVLLIALIAVLR